MEAKPKRYSHEWVVKINLTKRENFWKRNYNAERTLKTCSLCKQELEPSSFGLKKTSVDNLNSACKDCCRKRARRILQEKRMRSEPSS